RAGATDPAGGGRRGGGAAELMGRRRRPAGGALPARGGLADRGEQVLDRRLVAELARELAGAGSQPASELGVGGEAAQGLGGGAHVVRGDEEAVLLVAEQVPGGPHALGEDERQAAGGRLVD